MSSALMVSGSRVKASVVRSIRDRSAVGVLHTTLLSVTCPLVIRSHNAGVAAQQLEEVLIGGRCGSSTPPSPAPTPPPCPHRAGCCGHGPSSDAGRPWPRVDFSAIPRAQRRTAPCAQVLSARKLLALYATTDSHVLVLTRLARIRKIAHRHCSSRTSVCGLRRQ